MKSPSISPTRFFALIIFGLFSIPRLFKIPKRVAFLRLLFRASFLRCASIFLPYGLLIYVRMVTPETGGRSLWYFRIRFAVSSGDWSSSRYASTVARSFEWSAMVFGRTRVYLCFIYAWWLAYAALYFFPFLVRSESSYESALSAMPTSPAISFCETPRFKSDSINARSPWEICLPFFLFSSRQYTREFEFYL